MVKGARNSDSKRKPLTGRSAGPILAFGLAVPGRFPSLQKGPLVKVACCLVVCLAGAGATAAPDEKPTTRVYTNEDLDRLRSRRSESGAASEPAVEPARASRSGRDQAPARGEEFWRREAEREHRRLEPLRRRLAALEEKLEGRRNEPRRRFAADPMLDSIAAQIQALRGRIRDEQSRFEDRARREGALPGWLRQ